MVSLIANRWFVGFSNTVSVAMWSYILLLILNDPRMAAGGISVRELSIAELLLSVIGFVCNMWLILRSCLHAAKRNKTQLAVLMFAIWPSTLIYAFVTAFMGKNRVVAH